MDKKRVIEENQYLQTYNPDKYPKQSVAVDIVVFTVADRENENYRKLKEKFLKILLIRRGGPPDKGKWALPGGFVGDDSIEEAAHRELRTETNIQNIYIEQLYTWGDVNRDPRMRVVSCSYLSLIDSGSVAVRAGDDAAEAAWFDLYAKDEDGLITLTFEKKDLILEAKLEPERYRQGVVEGVNYKIVDDGDLAFDHARIIMYGLERLRSKVELTDIVFNLMPEKFTLSELQRVYEIIMNKPLIPAAFRRKIASSVAEISEYEKPAGHRPSKLYKYNRG